MPKSRPPYPPEYRQQLVDLVRGGRTPEELSREFEPSAQSIWNWVRQAELDGGLRSDGLTTEPRYKVGRRHAERLDDADDRAELHLGDLRVPSEYRCVSPIRSGEE